ncbi:hypothetical protein [Candidatus Palauibacter sp.]|uniref:hypothetical protein n=1 Tax=Candidatus Palauibacter sp. TaxID=3101350 RepID=UPI003CC6C53D
MAYGDLNIPTVRPPRAKELWDAQGDPFAALGGPGVGGVTELYGDPFAALQGGPSALDDGPGMGGGIATSPPPPGGPNVVPSDPGQLARPETEKEIGSIAAAEEPKEPEGLPPGWVMPDSMGRCPEGYGLVMSRDLAACAPASAPPDPPPTDPGAPPTDPGTPPTDPGTPPPLPPGTVYPPIPPAGPASGGDLQDLLNAYASGILKAPSRYDIPMVREGIGLINRSFDEGLREGGVHLDELMSQRGLVGSSIELGEHAGLVSDLSRLKQQHMFDLQREMATTQAYDRQAAAGIAQGALGMDLDRWRTERALELQRQGMNRDDAFRYADLEARQMIAGEDQRMQQMAIWLGLLQQAGLSEEQINQIMERLGLSGSQVPSGGGGGGGGSGGNGDDDEELK